MTYFWWYLGFADKSYKTQGCILFNQVFVILHSDPVNKSSFDIAQRTKILWTNTQYMMMQLRFSCSDLFWIFDDPCSAAAWDPDLWAAQAERNALQVQVWGSFSWKYPRWEQLWQQQDLPESAGLWAT